MKKTKNILLAVTGSIAAFKAAALASKLKKNGYELRVVLTEGAREFVGDATFEGLTGAPPLTSGFEEGSRMSHIHWARWADLTVIYPTTANTITGLAQGSAHDLLGMLFLAHDFKTPIWIAPAMNPAMYTHPAVREAREKLAAWGVNVLESDEGRTACGEVGEGRLIEPEEMLKKIETYFLEELKNSKQLDESSTESRSDATRSRTAQKKAILITAGGTSEKIDSVRVITNTSTGATGVGLALSLSQAGHPVTLLLSENSIVDADLTGVELKRFSDFKNLQDQLREKLSQESYDFVIHAAAVSDYGVDHVEDVSGNKIATENKIQSGDPLRLVLKPYPKIVNQLREFSKNKKTKLISFKLTVSEKSKPDLTSYDSDYIVHNDLSGLDRSTQKHQGELYKKMGSMNGEKIGSFKTKSELQAVLLNIIETEGTSS